MEILLGLLAIIGILLLIRWILKWWTGVNEVIENTDQTNLLLQKLLEEAYKQNGKSE